MCLCDACDLQMIAKYILNNFLLTQNSFTSKLNYNSRLNRYLNIPYFLANLSHFLVNILANAPKYLNPPAKIKPDSHLSCIYSVYHCHCEMILVPVRIQICCSLKYRTTIGKLSNFQEKLFLLQWFDEIC